MYLTSSEAQKMLQAAQAKAQQMGVKVSISVVDGRGDLLTMVRLDGASWRTAGISKGKAYASANFGVPSAELTARANSPVDRKSTRLNSSHIPLSRMPSSA